MKGKLIVIDGNDASGKKTQVEFLESNLKKLGLSVKKLDFPRYESFFGKIIGQYLNGDFGNLSEIDPKIPSLFFALDRFDEKKRIKKWLEDGNYVVLDRYVESNLAYQGAKIENQDQMRELLSWIETLEYEKFNLPKADIVIFLHVSTKYSKKLMKCRPDKEYIKDKRRDIHERDEEFLKRVEENYEFLYEKYGWKKIECVVNEKLLSKEKIADLVINTLKKGYIP
jgi:dTMP kinase